MGVFDEGCMGMFNAIIPDELLHPTGVYKERLSQSSLYAAMREVSDAEAAEERLDVGAAVPPHAADHVGTIRHDPSKIRVMGRAVSARMRIGTISR